MSFLIRRLYLLLMLVCSSCLHAHSVHQSTAEAEFNAATNKLEVSLTVFINDLELALIRHSEKMLSFEKTPAPEFNRYILDYLQKTFVATDTGGQAAQIEWLGRKLDTDSIKSNDPAVTLFFEVAMPAGIEGYALQHTVLCDLFKDQINLLLFRTGTETVQLKFQHGEGSRPLGPTIHPK